MNQITVKGAHLHNLKDIDVSIPKNKLTVATGVSGSGKSSLLFDIIFEEGKKQYLQSLGVFTGLDDTIKFDSITGIGPTIAVQQNIIRQSNPRSTVGSRTGILNTLALLFASEGVMTCTVCGTITDRNLICNKCGNSEERLPAGYFSYNNPNGMCLSCSGRGIYHQINMEKLLPHEQITLKNILDKIRITSGLRNVFHRHFGKYLDVPFTHIPAEIQADILYGHFSISNSSRRSICISRILEGNIRKFGRDPSGIYTFEKCPDCSGFRIGEEARNVFIKGKHIGELSTISINQLLDFSEVLLNEKEISETRQNLLHEIRDKLIRLKNARLGHLSLYREISTLSGGEMQRLFLMSHLNTNMDSLIYILDEPTAGLHESEKPELLNFVAKLKNLGNTVIVIEHDKTLIEAADNIIDIGPGAGVEGGHLLYEGKVQGLLQCEHSITGSFLSGKSKMPGRKKITIDAERTSLKIYNAKTNNLKNISVTLPLKAMVGICGLSGSGKSSLISDTLVPLLKEIFSDNTKTDNCEIDENDSQEDFKLVETVADRLEGYEDINGFAEVSQQSIGRNMNSTTVSYIGIWDKIRKIFAGEPESLNREMNQGYFSFNSKGACSSCSGSGVDKIWLGGNISISNTCKECEGKRYNEEALSITYKGKNIHDILEMSVSEALAFFSNDKTISHSLQVLDRIGMGYIKLGQPTPTLSGGEAQRIKLAKEIGKRRKGNILYILDEPTTGLSMHDTASLIKLLNELVEKGNSVFIIEHDINVLSVCDWIIELGPEGGVNGGQLIAEGRPEDLKNNPASITGAFL